MSFFSRLSGLFFGRPGSPVSEPALSERSGSISEDGSAHAHNDGVAERTLATSPEPQAPRLQPTNAIESPDQFADHKTADRLRRSVALAHHVASLPEQRFLALVILEERRLLEKWFALGLDRRHHIDGEERAALARKLVWRRWEEQGIRRAAWSKWWTPRGHWQHELVGAAEDNHCVPRDKDRSRPFYMFMEEVAAELEHLEFVQRPPPLPAYLIGGGPRPPFPEPRSAHDLFNEAYAKVRYEQWTALGLWDEAWVAVPGMAWKHERHPADLNRGRDVGAAVTREENDVFELFGTRMPQSAKRLRLVDYLPEKLRVDVERPGLGIFEGLYPPAEASGHRSMQQQRSTLGLGSQLRSPSPVKSREGGLFANLGSQIPGAGLARGDLGHGEDDFSIREDTYSVSDAPVRRAVSQQSLQRVQSLSDAGPESVWGDENAPPTDQLRPAAEIRSAATNSGWYQSRPGQPRAPLGTIHEEGGSSAYQDQDSDMENADPDVAAIQNELDRCHDAAKKLVAIREQLEAQMAVRRRSSTSRVRSVSPLGESSQHRVLGPRPSPQRVSKKARGEMVARSTGPGCSPGRARAPSELSTDVLSAQSSPQFPDENNRRFSLGDAGSQGTLAVNSFTIREDDDVVRAEASVEPKTEEDAEMEGPRTVLSPRARAAQRRRDVVERPSLQPVRRSARRALSRG